MEVQHSLEYGIEIPAYRFSLSPKLMFGTPLLCMVRKDPQENSYPLLKTYKAQVP